MRSPVYNAAILKMVNRSLRLAPGFRLALQILSLIPVLAIAVNAVDWSGPEQQLARKVVAVTGPGAVSLTLENHSSLGRRDNEVIGNGLRAALEAMGLRFVKAEQAAASVAITLSENPRSYVWVAQIRQAAGEAASRKGWTPLLELTAAISLNLGIFNLLPIPILDGGVIFFLFIEGLMRRDISMRIKERVYQAAFVFLVLFAVMVIYNDLMKTIPGLADKLP